MSNLQKKTKETVAKKETDVEKSTKRITFPNTHVRIQTAEGVRRTEKQRLIANRKKHSQKLLNNASFG